MECTKVKFSNEKFAVDYIEKLAKTSIRDTKPLRAYYVHIAPLGTLRQE